MKMDMSSIAVTLRLRQVTELRRVGLSLARSSAGLRIQKSHAANKSVLCEL
jgi:hypothetical protein